MKGLIALDIDGTLTDDLMCIPDPVIQYLEDVQEDWRICLATGRTFSFAKSIISQIKFPYLLVLQNGADVLQMPEKVNCKRSYISSTLLPLLEGAFVGQKEDYLIYSGYEEGDFCYFRPTRFSDGLLLYLYELKELSSAPWQALQDFSFPKEKSFPLIKGFGTQEQMFTVANQLQKIEEITTSVIRDPIAPSLFLNLITARGATKGKAIEFLAEQLGFSFVIAAGDDRNDLSMLKKAKERIVMDKAPKELQEIATIKGGSAREMGIISALQKAVQKR